MRRKKKKKKKKNRGEEDAFEEAVEKSKFGSWEDQKVFISKLKEKDAKGREIEAPKNTEEDEEAAKSWKRLLLSPCLRPGTEMRSRSSIPEMKTFLA